MSVRRSLSVLGLAFAAANATAQSGGAAAPSSRCDLASLMPAPAWSVAARESVGAAVRQANACVEQRDAACADDALMSLQTPTLSDDERALLAMPRAEVANLRGDTAAAVTIYREALTLPAIAMGLRRDLAWRLALVLNARGEFADALRVFDANVGCDNWTAEALGMRAIAYENLGARTFALENFEAAMRLYASEGRPAPAVFQSRYEALLIAEAPETEEGGDVVPLARRNPDYPQRALERGIAGWIVLEFDVTDLGTVDNVRVLKSSDEIFDQISIATLQRWRYVPRFENGLPIRSNGKQTLLTFCLDACRFRPSPPERGPDGRFLIP